MIPLILDLVEPLRELKEMVVVLVEMVEDRMVILQGKKVEVVVELEVIVEMVVMVVPKVLGYM
jgi:hypothetical protein